MTVALIWAQGNGGVIGRDNTIPWHVPEDARRFRDLTRGHRVVMGRKTWDSLPDRFRPLPDRVNVVVTTDATWSAPGAVVSHDLTATLTEAAASDETTMVMGGGEIYRAAIPFADVLYVTEIDVDVDGGDALAPAIDLSHWSVQTEGPWLDSRTGLRHRFVDYRRDTETPADRPAVSG